MNNKEIPNLEFTNIFADDDNDMNPFSYNWTADYYDLNWVTPRNNVFYEHMTPTPGTKTGDWTQAQLDLKSAIVFGDNLWDKNAIDSVEPDHPTDIPKKLDLNQKVADLVSGFRNTLPTKSEESKGKDTKQRKDTKELEDFSDKADRIYKGKRKCVSHQPSSTFACNRKLISTNTTEENVSENSEISGKPKRWGKEEDKLMYYRLKKLAEAYSVSIDDLSNPESMSNSTHYNMLLNLKREMGWIGTTRQILKRICILKKNKRLSVRDKRSLRKLIKEQVTNRVPDFDKILYEFPFKNVNEIKKVSKWGIILNKMLKNNKGEI